MSDKQSLSHNSTTNITFTYYQSRLVTSTSINCDKNCEIGYLTILIPKFKCICRGE